jgi:hypothetical protein
MSLVNLAALGSFVGGLAVVVSLIYLALQVRQSEKNQRGTIHQMRAALSTEVMLRIATADVARSFRAGLTGSPDITEAQFWQFFYAAHAIFRTTENAFVQHRDGLIDKRQLASAKASARGFLANRGYRALWLATRSAREPDFRAFMDELAAEAAFTPPVDLFATWKALLDKEASS